MKVKQNPVRRARFGRLAVACAVSLALGATACGGSDEPPAQAQQDGTETTLPAEGDPVDGGSLAVGIPNDATGWNPTADQWGVAPALAGSTMLEALTTLDADANAVPCLAVEWTPNEDATSWTVKLREGVTFHDGQPFDADAVKANMDDVLKSPLTGIALGGAIEETKVIDEYTVQIDLSLSWAAFPSSFLAGPNAWMRAPAMLEAGPEGSKNPIGTGAFKFESWESNSSLKVVKNADYWREGEPHLDQIEFFPITDDISRVNALQSGDIDMMLSASADDATGLDGEYTVIRDWDTETTLLLANTRPTAGGAPNPMSNLHARKAIAHATDPKAVASLVGQDIEVPFSPFSAENPWGDPSVADDYPAFDLAKAKEEVEAYKAETGEATLSVTLLGPSDTGTVAQMQTVQQQWVEAGIESKIDAMDYNAFSLRGVQGDFQLIYGPIFSAPDPDQNYHFWSESTVAEDGAIGINFSAFANEETQAALTTGRESSVFDERKAAYADLISEQNKAAVNIWLYFTPYSLVASDRVHGLQMASEIPFGNFQPKTWWSSVWVTE